MGTRGWRTAQQLGTPLLPKETAVQFPVPRQAAHKGLQLKSRQANICFCLHGHCTSTPLPIHKKHLQNKNLKKNNKRAVKVAQSTEDLMPHLASLDTGTYMCTCAHTQFF